MEDSVSHQHEDSHRRRVRVPRKRTPWKRLKKFLEMPHLKRRDRNQRLAIVGVVVIDSMIDLLVEDRRLARRTS